MKYVIKLAAFLFKDKSGEYVLIQPPNWQIISALCALVAYWLLPNGNAVQAVAVALFILLFAVWGYEELMRGVTRFRRLLGFAALVLNIYFVSSLV